MSLILFLLASSCRELIPTSGESSGNPRAHMPEHNRILSTFRVLIILGTRQVFQFLSGKLWISWLRQQGRLSGKTSGPGSHVNDAYILCQVMPAQLQLGPGPGARVAECRPCSAAHSDHSALQLVVKPIQNKIRRFDRFGTIGEHDSFLDVPKGAICHREC